MAEKIIGTGGGEGKAPTQIISFQSQQARTFTENGEIWFAALDVCRVLSLSWHGKTLARIPEEWKRVYNRLAYISESAVYRLVFRSKKPEAIALAIISLPRFCRPSGRRRSTIQSRCRPSCRMLPGRCRLRTRTRPDGRGLCYMA